MSATVRTFKLAGTEARLAALFLMTNRLAVVCAGWGSTSTFSEGVALSLQSSFGNTIALAYMDVLSLDATDSAIAGYVRQRQAAIGHTPTGVPLPGYYLFIDRQAVAYDPGLPDLTPQLAIGAKLAEVFGILTDSPVIAGIGGTVYDFTVGVRLAAHFAPFVAAAQKAHRGATTDEEASQSRKAGSSPNWTPEADLRRAYGILGVSPEISSPALKARYKALVVEWHTDRQDQSDPSRLRQAHERMAALNTSYELIREHRRRLGEDL
ncbi:MAG: J domain-containing protein [Polyangiaceae bacterium]